jgi:membrane protease YdiL (CAAX protease family)
MRHWFRDADGKVRNGWKALGFMLACVVCFIAVGLSKHVIPPGVRLFVPSIVLIVAGILLVTFAAARLEGVSMASIGLKPDRRFAMHLGTGFAAGAGLIVLAAAGVWALGGVDFVRVPQASAASALKSAGMFLGVAIFEELSMRGYALQRTMRGIGTGWALFVFAVLFTVAHLPGNTGVEAPLLVLALFNIFLAAYLLSFCYLRTGSLALPIGVHWGWNWLQAMLGFGVSGEASHGLWMPVFQQRPAWLTGGAFGLEASVAATAVEALAILMLVRWKGSSAQGLPAGRPHAGNAYAA